MKNKSLIKPFFVRFYGFLIISNKQCNILFFVDFSVDVQSSKLEILNTFTVFMIFIVFKLRGEQT